ncbi:MAG: hypothetical protein PHZ07_01145 [Patescibacteria group bacterium]|nr:hypothetical protein [Patescibacteria group bacterium]MDD4303957.1 hypothetical protein [Patescibacteria group bacterium]MDD4695054.1 hypothetical protein [Patescibacteria group bacterium]
MKLTKKIFIFIYLLILVNFFQITLFTAKAIETPAGGSYGLTDTARQAGLTEDGKVEQPQDIASRIVGFILAFVGVIILNNMIFAGYAWMTAGGSEEKIKAAKQKMTNSIIGLIIILASYIIVNSVLGLLNQVL